MNEVLKTIANRYSCRSYKDVMPDDATLRAIAQAGVSAPSGMNRRPWQVIIVKDTALIREIDDAGMAMLKAQPDQSMYERMMGRSGNMLYGAPCMMVVVSKPDDRAEMDCGIVAQNITLAATSLGLGSVICGLMRIPLDGEKGADFKKRLSFSDGYEFGIAVLLGYEDKKGEPSEPALDKILTVE
ncbi:MAG: nitroreductase family protein [Clostridiales bacterium]|nr:nitroreductase family protein [Clostridiales bacterium]